MIGEMANDEQITIDVVSGDIFGMYPRLHSKCYLGLVVRYVEHYVSGAAISVISKPLRGPDLLANGVTEWDSQFINLPEGQLGDLVAAANYLSIPSLLDLCGAKIASIIKSQTPEELMKRLGITEVTPEWEAKVRAENPWCRDVVEGQ